MSAPFTDEPGEQPQDWFFTFGHEHWHGSEPLGRRYVRVNGTFLEARAAMFEIFGRRWAFQCESAESAGIPGRGLTEITIPGLAVSEEASAAFALLAGASS